MNALKRTLGLIGIFSIGVAFLVFALGFAYVLGEQSEMKNGRAATELLGIRFVLELFRSDLGRFPTQSEGLAILAQPVGRGPYCENRNGFRDPWGRPYIYQVDENGTPTVESLGADGLPGGGGEDADLKVRPEVSTTGAPMHTLSMAPKERIAPRSLDCRGNGYTATAPNVALNGRASHYY
jgi:general secretion pathway protein G